MSGGGRSERGQKKLAKKNATWLMLVGVVTPVATVLYVAVRFYAWPALFDVAPLSMMMKAGISTMIFTTVCSALWLYMQLGAWAHTELMNSPAMDLLFLCWACLLFGLVTDWIFLLVAVVPLYLFYKVGKYALDWILTESASEREARLKREADKAEADERDRKRRAREDRRSNRSTKVAGRRREH